MDITAFWNRIKNLCKETGVTQLELSEKLGYGNRNLSVKIARKSLPNVRDLEIIANTFGVSFDYLIDGVEISPSVIRLESKRFFVPILNQQLSAGNGQILKDDEITGYISVPPSIRAYGENIAALYVNGDSMEPTLRRGDLVVCDSCGYDGEGLYALKKDGDGYVKRVYKDSGKYIIKSDNPLYPLMEEPVGSDAIAIIGRVHYIIKKCD